jgi:dethiobiotin synthase
MTPPILLVTGTDTGVGKTIATAALAACLVAAPGSSSGGRPTVTVDKPVQTGAASGEPADTDVIRRLVAAVATSEGVRLALPMAPVQAARHERRSLPALAAHAARIRELARRHDRVLVEGAGGLLVELDGTGRTLVDLAQELGDDAAVIVVCRSGLGTLNHTALTLDALDRRGLPVAGTVIGSWPAHPDDIDLENHEHLSSLEVPLLGAIPHGAGLLTPDGFVAGAATWFSVLP